MSCSASIVKHKRASVASKMKINRGTEAARAALEITNVMSDLRAK